MLSCLAALALLQAQAPEHHYAQVFLQDPSEAVPQLMMMVGEDRLDPPKFSPRKFDGDPWEFDWYCAGMAKHVDKEPYSLKFVVYSQEHKVNGIELAPVVERMFLRLWQLNYKKLKIDHLPLYNNKVDVYLCYGGKAGGEQRFDVDMDQAKPPHEIKVDTIYIYDLTSFTDPVEEAREIAHEYGHAVLPAVGGFDTPEDWGNGQLGEKVFLRWMRDELAAGRLITEDMMGASLKGLNAWVARNVDPLVLQNATNGPSFGLLEGKGQASMDAFTGLVCYAESILGDEVVGLSLKLTSDKAKDYPGALLEACKQKERVVVGIPALLKGKDLWVPLGNGKVNGGTVLKRSGDWAQIRPGLTAITLLYGS